jgi:uncharacterized membrane protein
MQNFTVFHLLGFVLILAGILLIIIGAFYLLNSSVPESKSTRESKGIILIGPIPILWGFGRKGKIIGASLFVFIIVVWIILVFL